MQILINKTQQSVEVSDLPQVSQEFIFAYGLRQILNDCHSSIQRKDYETDGAFHTAVMEAVNNKLAALTSGDITTRRGSSEPVDPVERVALRMAKDAVKSALKAKGISLKKLPEGKFEELATSHLESKREAFIKLAKAEVKRQAEASVEVDISDLMA